MIFGKFELPIGRWYLDQNSYTTGQFATKKTQCLVWNALYDTIAQKQAKFLHSSIVYILVSYLEPETYRLQVPTVLTLKVPSAWCELKIKDSDSLAQDTEDAVPNTTGSQTLLRLLSSRASQDLKVLQSPHFLAPFRTERFLWPVKSCFDCCNPLNWIFFIPAFCHLRSRQMVFKPGK